MKLVILDRDGVINQDSDDYVKSVDEWIPLPGSAEAIARLSQAGIIVAVATNQSGIARGYFSEQTLADMHAKMHGLVEQAGGKISQVLWCPHGPDDQCSCRKPLPGMVSSLLNEFNVNASDAIMVGDSPRDLEAGAAVGVLPFLVKTGKGQRTLDAGKKLPEGTGIYEDLSQLVAELLKQS